MEIILKNTFHFKIASDFIQKDITLIPLAGKVKYFGMFPLVAVSSNGDGEIIFTIIGEKETVDATAIVENNQVISVEYK